MTATATPPGLSDRVLRIPTIAANLLPAEIVDARRSRKVRRAVCAGLAGVVLALAGWFVFAVYQTSAARDDLANRQAEAQVLTRQQHAYADLVNTQAQSQAIQAQLHELFADDMDWASLITHVRDAAPNSVTISTLTASGGDDKASKVPAGSATPDPDQVGTLTISGTGPNKAAVAAYVDNLARVPGLSNAYLNSANTSPNGVDYRIRVDIVKAALGGRYSSPAPKGSGS